MRIKKIKLKNLKGITGEFDLTENNIIVGANASGKTAILDAIRLCFIGYHPKLGKTPRSLFSLSSGNEMSCQVQMDNGDFCSFSLTLSGGSVKKDWQPLNISDSAKIQLDPSLFFDSSKADKRNTIFSILGNSDPQEVIKNLNHSLENVATSGTTLESEVLDSVKSKISEIFQSSKMTNEALSLAIDFIKDAVSQANSASKRMDKTLEGLAQVTGHPQLMLQNESFYENQVSDLETKKKILEEKVFDKKQVQSKILDLKQDLVASKKQEKQKPSFERINQLKKEISEIEETFAKSEALYQSNLAKLEHKVEKSDAVSKSFKNESLEKVLSDIPDGTYIAKVEIAKANEDIATAVWEVSDFEANENRGKVVALIADFEDVQSAFEQSIWPLRAELEQLQNVKEEKEDGSATAYIEEQIELHINKLNSLDYKDTYEDELEAICNEIVRVRELLKKASKNALEIEKITQVRDEASKVELELKYVKELQKKILSFAEELSNKTLNGLLSSMNKFAAGIGLTPYSVQDGEVGYYQNGVFVSYETFSGSEMAILRCALTIALAMKSEYKLAVIDELGRFDEERKRKSFITIKELIDNGHMNQFIGVDVIAPLSTKHNVITTI